MYLESILMNRKHLFALVFSSLLFIPTFGQKGGERQRPKIGVLTGKVLDEVSGDPMEFVSVALYSAKDSSLVTGGTTVKSGYFEITEIPVGKFYVELMFMGYEKLTISDLLISPRSSVEKDLGTLKLKPFDNELGEVEVSERSEYYTMSIDRKSYKVEELPLTEGGTTADVFVQIPSIQIDIEGNVSLRGSTNVTILVDGKPSTMVSGDPQAFLESFPADAIERIEVITNPGAKYDPEGMGGIINIITKKNKLEGFGGSLNLSAGTYDKYSASGSINYKTGKWNLSSSFSLNHRFSFSDQIKERESVFNDVSSFLDQSGHGTRIRSSNYFKLGTDYYINPRNTVSFGAGISKRGGTRKDANTYLFSDENGLMTSSNSRAGETPSESFNYDVNAGYIWEKGKGHDLRLDIRYSHSDQSSDGIYQDLFFDGNGESIDSLLNNQRNLSEGYFNLGNLRLDYVRPIGEAANLEAGINYDLRQSRTDLKSYNQSAIDPDFILDSGVSNDFIYTEQFYSVYGNYSIEKGKWSTKLGARVEQAYAKSDQRTQDTIFNQDYFNVYPSAYLKYAFSEKSQLKGSYSRRIQRPRGRQVNPFTSISDPLNIRTGNPYLTPEYTNSFEIEHSQFLEKGMLNSSIYYRYTTDIISYAKVVDSAGVSYTTYANLDQGSSYGLEFIFNHRTSKKWTNNISANLYRRTFDGDNLSSYFSNEGMAFSTRLMSTYVIEGNWSFQGSFNYSSPRPIAQGRIGEMYSLDLAIKKEIWERKASISLRATDIFWTRQFNYESAAGNFTEESLNQFNSRNIYISFSYRFGNYQSKKSRRSNDNQPSDSGNDDMI